MHSFEMRVVVLRFTQQFSVSASFIHYFSITFIRIFNKIFGLHLRSERLNRPNIGRENKGLKVSAEICKIIAPVLLTRHFIVKLSNQFQAQKWSIFGNKFQAKSGNLC
jgi:hypothetical protein